MKQFVFIDNFRGFTDTLVPIEQVNFLVGENSTGKTSLLGLLNILSTFRFWISGDLASEDVRFGRYDDILSSAAERGSVVSIGVLDLENELRPKRSPDNWYFSLISFGEYEGAPRVSAITLNKDSRAISAKISETQTLVCEFDLSKPTASDAGARECFSRALEFHRQRKGQFEPLVFGKESRPVGDFFEVQARLRQKLSKEPDIRGLSMPAPAWAEMVWLAPIRSKPRRTYDEYRLEYSAEGDHTPYIIKRTLERKKDAERFERFMDRIGKDSGLFEKVRVKKYGRGATSPFELDIILNRRALSVSNVGYGVSQALPVIVELFVRPKETWFAIQQPEVHLHPRAQAAIGDMLFELAVEDRKHFFVETHSDFAIDRFRMNFRSSKSCPSSQILFFERGKSGNVVTPVRIDKNGELPERQPEQYRNFFVAEQFRLIGG